MRRHTLLKSSPRLAYSAVLFVKMPIPTWMTHNHQHLCRCAYYCNIYCSASALHRLL